jgi:ABC-type multidrug transport system, ATPase component
MAILSVKGLTKRYEKFTLKEVSFELEQGFIMGFIGSNGAGKTTTLKSILNLVHKDGGAVEILGKDFSQNELALKQEIGFTFGGVDYYEKSRIKNITDVVRRFYTQWDEDTYAKYMRRFAIDARKKVAELSHGMRVKYSLALALSHRAKLLILDEPTSGLDPVARDDLLELFQELIEDGERSILFSTHITSDLEKCADFITYIQNGGIIESRAKDDLIAAYRLVKGTRGQLGGLKPVLISHKEHAFGFTGLLRTADLKAAEGVTAEPPSIEDIMIYHEKREAEYERFAV